MEATVNSALLLEIVMWVSWVTLCVRMAQKRNRDPVLAGVAGLLFGLFAVIYYWRVKPKEA